MKRAFWIGVIGYIGVVFLVFGHALFPPAGQMIFGDDIHRQYYFFREFFNYWVAHGIFPWWNPYLFGGEPFIANPVVNIWYPPNWLFSVLPLNIAYSWHLALHIFWAMLGMFILLKSWVGKGSAWIGGVIFGLSGFFMARTFAGHVDVIAAASWMPWVVGAFWKLSYAEVANKNLDLPRRQAGASSVARSHRSSRLPLRASEAAQNFIGSPRTFVFASIVFAMQLLAGYQTMAFFTGITVVIITLVYSFKIKSVLPIFRAGCAAVVGVCLAAIQILPEQEFFRQSIRTFALPYSWISYGSYTWKSLVQLVNPFYFGNQFTYHGPPPNFIEHSAFVGVGGLVLAILALIVLFRRITNYELRITIFSFLSIVFFGIWVSLGPNAPVDLQKILWQLVPMYHYLRIPPRHLVLVIFGLSGLAAIGLSIIKNKTVQVIVGAVVILEMVLFGRSFIVFQPIPQMRHDSELVHLLTSDTEPFRVLQNFGVWLPTRDVLDFDSVMSYGIFSATGYDPSILKNYYSFIAKASGTSGQKAVLSQDVQVPYVNTVAADQLDFLNIKYLMVPTQYDSFIGNPRYHLLREDVRRDFRLYENTTVRARFFFANPECGSANVISYTPNKIVLTVDATCDAELLSSEVYYPGWHATVDGKKVNIINTNDAFRTLFVSAGKHTIIYEYQPVIFLVGLGISIFTIILMILGFRYISV